MSKYADKHKRPAQCKYCSNTGVAMPATGIVIVHTIPIWLCDSHAKEQKNASGK